MPFSFRRRDLRVLEHLHPGLHTFVDHVQACIHALHSPLLMVSHCISEHSFEITSLASESVLQILLVQGTS
jgi:hypothetical protein